MSSDQIMFMLGEIKGQLKGLGDTVAGIDGKVDKIDGRLRKVEVRAAINGGVTGGVAGIGLSLLAAKIKTGLGL